MRVEVPHRAPRLQAPIAAVPVQVDTTRAITPNITDQRIPLPITRQVRAHLLPPPVCVASHTHHGKAGLSVCQAQSLWTSQRSSPLSDTGSSHGRRTSSPPRNPAATAKGAQARQGAKGLGAYIGFLDLTSIAGCASIAGMPKVTLVVSVEEKALWVASAHGELTSLADWIRRACGVRAGLGAGDDDVPEPGVRPSTEVHAGSNPAVVSPAPSLRPHRADPKDKAAMEHGRGEKKSSGGMCAHRVPAGSFCKRCEEENH